MSPNPLPAGTHQSVWSVSMSCFLFSLVVRLWELSSYPKKLWRPAWRTWNTSEEERRPKEERTGLKVRRERATSARKVPMMGQKDQDSLKRSRKRGAGMEGWVCRLPDLPRPRLSPRIGSSPYPTIRCGHCLSRSWGHRQHHYCLRHHQFCRPVPPPPPSCLPPRLPPTPTCPKPIGWS